MRLDVKGLALALAVFWGGSVLLVALVHQVWAPHGAGFLQWVAVFYPGYDGPAGMGSVAVVTLYAALDGLIGGAILAWLYNRFAGGA